MTDSSEVGNVGKCTWKQEGWSPHNVFFVDSFVPAYFVLLLRGTRDIQCFSEFSGGTSVDWHVWVVFLGFWSPCWWDGDKFTLNTSLLAEALLVRFGARYAILMSQFLMSTINEMRSRFLLQFWLQYIFAFANAYIDISIYHLLVASSCPTRSLRMHRHWKVVDILQRKTVLDWRLLWFVCVAKPSLLIHAEGLRNKVIVTKSLLFFPMTSIILHGVCVCERERERERESLKPLSDGNLKFRNGCLSAS